MEAEEQRPHAKPKVAKRQKKVKTTPPVTYDESGIHAALASRRGAQKATSWLVGAFVLRRCGWQTRKHLSLVVKLEKHGL